MNVVQFPRTITLKGRFHLMKREFYRIASPTAADALPQIPGLERLRHGLPKHGAVVDGGQPEGELGDIAFRLFTLFKTKSHGRDKRNKIKFDSFLPCLAVT